MMAVSIAGDPTRANDTTRFTLSSINHKPIVNLGHDTTLCLASSILLNAYDPAASSYYWWNGTVTPGYNINSTFCGGAPGHLQFLGCSNRYQHLRWKRYYRAHMDHLLWY